MTNSKSIETYRQHAIDRINSGDFVSGIIINGRHEAVGYDPARRCYGRDGHSIIARAAPRFDFSDDQIARLTFRQGSSPRVLAASLRSTQ